MSATCIRRWTSANHIANERNQLQILLHPFKGCLSSYIYIRKMLDKKCEMKETLFLRSFSVHPP